MTPQPRPIPLSPSRPAGPRRLLGGVSASSRARSVRRTRTGKLYGTGVRQAGWEGGASLAITPSASRLLPPVPHVRRGRLQNLRALSVGDLGLLDKLERSVQELERLLPRHPEARPKASCRSLDQLIGLHRARSLACACSTSSEDSPDIRHAADLRGGRRRRSPPQRRCSATSRRASRRRRRAASSSSPTRPGRSASGSGPGVTPPSPARSAGRSTSRWPSSATPRRLPCAGTYHPSPAVTWRACRRRSAPSTSGWRTCPRSPAWSGCASGAASSRSASSSSARTWTAPSAS